MQWQMQSLQLIILWLDGLQANPFGGTRSADCARAARRRAVLGPPRSQQL